MSDNELIAEFMGGQRSKRSPDTVFYFTPDFRGSGFWHIDYIPFDRSWDWLMPAVIKCHEIGDAKERKYPEEKDLDDPTGWRSWSYRRVGLSTNIKQVYENVVEFIKWYNQNK